MNIFEKRKYQKMIKDYENKYDFPGYKPVDLEDSITWHQHIYETLKDKSDQAEMNLRSYQQKLVDVEMTKRAEDNKKPGFPDDPQLGRMVFLPENDEKLKRLQMDRDNCVSDMVGMTVKITRLKALLTLQGNVKL